MTDARPTYQSPLVEAFMPVLLDTLGQLLMCEMYGHWPSPAVGTNGKGIPPDYAYCYRCGQWGQLVKK